MESERLLDLLPWRHPFLMIDRMIECVPHERIVTIKRISGNDIMSLAHRPDGSLFPGMMVLEGMNQSAALLYRLTYGEAETRRLPLLGQMRASFPGTAAPGDTITYTVRAVKMTPTHGLFEGWAEVEESPIAEGELAFAVVHSETKLGAPVDGGPSRGGAHSGND